jgi:streptogramin lyase
MNARRQIVSIIATAAVALPAVSPAEAPAPGQAACLKALMASLAETYQPAPRLREASFVNNSAPFDVGGANAQWVLTAINPKNNRPVARATCVVARSGRILEFNEEPVR